LGYADKIIKGRSGGHQNTIGTGSEDCIETVFKTIHWINFHTLKLHASGFDEWLQALHR